MKSLLLIFAFLLTSCSEPITKHSGRIVQMFYSVYNEQDTTVVVMTDKGTVRMLGSPYFKKLQVGDEISVICENTILTANCYFDSKVKK